MFYVTSILRQFWFSHVFSSLFLCDAALKNWLRKASQFLSRLQGLQKEIWLISEARLWLLVHYCEMLVCTPHTWNRQIDNQALYRALRGLYDHRAKNRWIFAENGYSGTALEVEMKYRKSQHVLLPSGCALLGCCLVWLRMHHQPRKCDWLALH